MRKIRVLFGIAGGLAVCTGALLLFLFVFGDHFNQKQDDRFPSIDREQALLNQIQNEQDNKETLSEQDNPQQEHMQETPEEQRTVAPVLSDDTNQTEPQDKKEFSMAFMGDTYFNSFCIQSYQTYGMEGLLDVGLLNMIQTADISVLNNECAISERGTPMEDKQYTFRMPSRILEAYVDMGIDAVSLANNHSLDFGDEALLDTFKALDEYGIKYLGAGEDDDRARQAAIYEIGDNSVAVLAASRVIPEVGWNIINHQPGLFCTYDTSALVEEIRKCKETCDYVVVYVHWGVMYEDIPKEYQRSMAKAYIDAGADAVIGAHSHVIQSVELYQGKPIFYSLGNFLFGAGTVDTILLLLETDGAQNLIGRIIPCHSNQGKITPMNEEDTQNYYRYIEQISETIQIDEQGYVKELEHGRRKTE